MAQCKCDALEAYSQACVSAGFEPQPRKPYCPESSRPSTGGKATSKVTAVPEPKTTKMLPVPKTMTTKSVPESKSTKVTSLPKSSKSGEKAVYSTESKTGEVINPVTKGDQSFSVPTAPSVAPPTDVDNTAGAKEVTSTDSGDIDNINGRTTSSAEVSVTPTDESDIDNIIGKDKTTSSPGGMDKTISSPGGMDNTTKSSSEVSVTPTDDGDIDNIVMTTKPKPVVIPTKKSSVSEAAESTADVKTPKTSKTKTDENVVYTTESAVSSAPNPIFTATNEVTTKDNKARETASNAIQRSSSTALPSVIPSVNPDVQTIEISVVTEETKPYSPVVTFTDNGVDPSAKTQSSMEPSEATTEVTSTDSGDIYTKDKTTFSVEDSVTPTDDGDIDNIVMTTKPKPSAKTQSSTKTVLSASSSPSDSGDIDNIVMTTKPKPVVTTTLKSEAGVGESTTSNVVIPTPDMVTLKPNVSTKDSSFVTKDPSSVTKESSVVTKESSVVTTSDVEDEETTVEPTVNSMDLCRFITIKIIILKFEIFALYPFSFYLIILNSMTFKFYPNFSVNSTYHEEALVFCRVRVLGSEANYACNNVSQPCHPSKDHLSC